MERIDRLLTRLTGQRLGRTGKRVWEVRGHRLFLAQAGLRSFSFAARCAVSAIRPCKVALLVLQMDRAELPIGQTAQLSHRQEFSKPFFNAPMDAYVV